MVARSIVWRWEKMISEHYGHTWWEVAKDKEIWEDTLQAWLTSFTERAGVSHVCSRYLQTPRSRAHVDLVNLFLHQCCLKAASQ